jgi:hypothetical protein
VKNHADLSSPYVAECNQYDHVSGGVRFGDILDVLKVKRGTSLDNIPNGNGGPQKLKYDCLPDGYLTGTEEKQVDGSFFGTTDRA